MISILFLMALNQQLVVNTQKSLIDLIRRGKMSDKTRNAPYSYPEMSHIYLTCPLVYLKYVLLPNLGRKRTI